MWPFNRVKREDIEELHDRLDEINSKLNKFAVANIESEGGFDIDKLPDDPVKLQRIIQSRRLKRQLLSQEMRVGQRTYHRRPEPEDGESETEAPVNGSMSGMALDIWKGLNPLVRTGIKSLAGKYGLDIDSLLQNEQALGALIQGVGGMAIGKLNELTKKPGNGQLGVETPVGVPAGLILAPYSPNIGPMSRNLGQQGQQA